MRKKELNNQLTKKELKKFFKEIIEIIHVEFKQLGDKIETFGGSNSEYVKGLKKIENKIDQLRPLLNHIRKRQTILEAKMKLIEEYFDDTQKN